MGLLEIGAALWLAGGAPATAAPSMAEAVQRIQSADYRGDRAELQNLAAALDGVTDPTLAAYRHYWRGFALWRRALNGFNETPVPRDLESDLRAAIASFEAALGAKPDWIEARIGIFGCGGPLYMLLKDDEPRREALLKEYSPLIREVGAQRAGNPRALWLVGQSQLGPGANAAAASSTFHRGIEAALAEARETPASEPAWVPRWGGAENLMNLAFLHSQSSLKNRELALAYLEGTLVAVPEWHYVREILRPQIEALPAADPAAAAAAHTP